MHDLLFAYIAFHIWDVHVSENYVQFNILFCQ